MDIVINEMSLTFSGKSMNESFARTAVSAFILPLDPTITELADIKTAVSEAVTNSIIHGYEYGEGQIRLDAKIYSNGKVAFTDNMKISSKVNGGTTVTLEKYIIRRNRAVNDDDLG